MPISSTGVIITPSATALAEAQQIFIDTYGINVNLDPVSPNGLLIQNIALAITKRENDQADTVNSFNPNIATGNQLDAICANLDIERIPATFSTATVQITGLTGVSIPALTQVQSVNGDIFLTDAIIVIGAMGTATGSVTAQVSGPISVAANTINKIITGINGWSTINNSGAGTQGVLGQSDAQLRQTRVSQLAAASSGSLAAVLAGARAFNPTSAYVRENKTTSSETINGITLAPKSILLVQEGGGSDPQIGNMFYQKLSGGCAMSGSHSYTFTPEDTTVPFVANWQIATPRVLSLNINLKLGSVYPPSLPAYIASIINNPDNFSFDVIGKFIDATQFIFLLIQNGISPVISLTFGVGASLGLNTYTMPISDSLGTSIASGNITVNYV